jgi:hypothetical protein
MFYGCGATEQVTETELKRNATPRWRLCKVVKNPESGGYDWAALAIKDVVREITPEVCDSVSSLRCKPVTELQTEWEAGLITDILRVDHVTEAVFLQAALWVPAKRPATGRISAAALSRPPEAELIPLILSLGLDRALDLHNLLPPKDWENWHKPFVNNSGIVKSALHAFCEGSATSEIPTQKAVCRRDILGLARAALVDDGANAALSRVDLGGHLVCRCLTGACTDRIERCTKHTNPLGLCGATDGSPPGEQVALAGAFAVIDLFTGRVCKALAFCIPNRGIGLDNSTIAEGETMVHGIRAALEVAVETQQQQQADGTQNGEQMTITAWTDNQSVVRSANIHVAGNSTLPKLLKSKTGNPIRCIRRLNEYAKTLKMPLFFRHQKNEHGRLLSATRYGIIAKLNRAADAAAGAATKPVDAEAALAHEVATNRRADPQADGYGGPTLLALHRHGIDKDVKGELKKAMALSQAQYLAGGDGVQGNVTRQIRDGQVDRSKSGVPKIDA